MIRVGPDMEAQFPGSSALATECVLNLAHVAGAIEAYGTEIIRERGIPSAAAFNVLTILHGAGEPLPPSVIAERMIVTRGTVTGLLDSLERRKLVRRSRHRADGRMRLVAITPTGIDVVDELLPSLHRAEIEVMAALTPAQQRRLLALLARLEAGIPAR